MEVEARLQPDYFASLLKRLVGGFQHSYNVQSRGSVIKWLLVVYDAVDEIRRFQLQGFNLFDARRPHIAGTVADEQLIDSVTAHLHALVIYLQLFVSFEIIPHQHLLLTADESGAHLHG